jgi:hypothetical protein
VRSARTLNWKLIMLDHNQKPLQWLLKKSSGSQTGKISTDRVLNGFSSDLGLDPISTRRELHMLRESGRIEYSSTPGGEPVSSFIKVVKPSVTVPAHMLQWQDILANDSRLTDENKIVLYSLGGSLDGFSEESMRNLIGGLVQLKKDQGNLSGKMAFSVSAEHLLGSSKLLSTLDKKVLKAFGINADSFVQRPPYIVIGGQYSAPKAIILVENPVAFESAVGTSAADKCVFVCTFGFGLSGVGNDYGFQLASVVETGNAIILQRTPGASISLKDLLKYSNVHFWGDLDIAGMQIFERLSVRIPQIRLSALYAPMIEAASDPNRRHPYVVAVGKSGQTDKNVRFNRKDAEAILKHCENWAVDQEIVNESDIQKLAGLTLELE